MRLCNECKQDYARTNDGLCISCTEGLIESLHCDLIEKDKKIAGLEMDRKMLKQEAIEANDIIVDLVAKNCGLKNCIELHAGDVCSLNNEIEQIREQLND